MPWRRNSGLFSLAGLTAVSGLLAAGCQPPTQTNTANDPPPVETDERVEPGGMSGDGTSPSEPTSP